MQMRRLGRTGLEVSAIGCGGIPIFRAEKPEAVKVLRRAMDRGVNYFDTARGYAKGGGEERLASGLLDIERGLAETKKKVVNAERFKGTLTTFSDMYADALPEERKELMRLHIHQLIWTPSRIRMAIYETPKEPLLTISGKVRSVVSSGSPYTGFTETFVYLG